VAGRGRFAFEAVRAVREQVGDRLAILVKVNLDDGFTGGLGTDDACETARGFEDAGAHALVMSGGFTSRSAFYLMRGGLPLPRMIEVEKSPSQKLALRFFGKYLVRAFDFEEMFFMEKAKQMRQAVKMPLVLLGGILSGDNLRSAMGEGFEFVALGRALIADPDFVKQIESGEIERSRCISCNACVPEMDAGGIRCVLDDTPSLLPLPPVGATGAGGITPS